MRWGLVRDIVVESRLRGALRPQYFQFRSLILSRRPHPVHIHHYVHEFALLTIVKATPASYDLFLLLHLCQSRDIILSDSSAGCQLRSLARNSDQNAWYYGTYMDAFTLSNILNLDHEIDCCSPSLHRFHGALQRKLASKLISRFVSLRHSPSF